MLKKLVSFGLAVSLSLSMAVPTQASETKTYGIETVFGVDQAEVERVLENLTKAILLGKNTTKAVQEASPYLDLEASLWVKSHISEKSVDKEMQSIKVYHCGTTTQEGYTKEYCIAVIDNKTSVVVYNTTSAGVIESIELWEELL